MREGRLQGTDKGGKGNTEPSSPQEPHLNKPKKKYKCLVSVKSRLPWEGVSIVDFPKMCWPIYHHYLLYKKTLFTRFPFQVFTHECICTHSYKHAYTEATKLT